MDPTWIDDGTSPNVGHFAVNFHLGPPIEDQDNPTVHLVNKQGQPDWTDPQGRSVWSIEFDLLRIEGNLVVDKLLIHRPLDKRNPNSAPDTPDSLPYPAGIDVNTLRKIPLGRIVDSLHLKLVARRQTQDQWKDTGPDAQGRTLDDHKIGSAKVAASVKKVGGRGPKAKPDSFYLEVADLYLSLQETSEGRTAQAVADHYGAKLRTVRNWVRGAAERKYLNPGRQGKSTREHGKKNPKHRDYPATERRETS